MQKNDEMGKHITSSTSMNWGSQTGDERSISFFAMCVATSCSFEFVTNGVVGESLNWIWSVRKKLSKCKIEIVTYKLAEVYYR
jgi:hypothetical protein